jgi:hypothetical protein
MSVVLPCRIPFKGSGYTLTTCPDFRDHFTWSRHGKPTDNAFVESFSGKIPSEGIDQTWFLSLDDARSKCEA